MADLRPVRSGRTERAVDRGLTWFRDNDYSWFLVILALIGLLLLGIWMGTTWNDAGSDWALGPTGR
ncbi:MAG TPA: hypothetical protein VNZ52_09015 [Candidatus Thermoplasmatota archaeon]|nr:hypothetical protein [Candidatus Thermoplasmatota archaeon]